ncbi:unnamed protein product, partial [marine sediment metagenome]
LSFPECNPFIICYYNSYYDPSTRQFLIEMEYIDGEDMFNFVLDSGEKNNSELHYYLLLLMTKDLAKGLKYIHSKNILHNDIKLENVMIDRNYVPRIIDFGLACHTLFKEHLGQYCDSVGGTPDYIAPEFFKLKMRTPATDMWALGILLYIAVMKEYPYGENYNVQDLFYKIENNKAPKINTSNELGVDGIEFDVRRCYTGEIVLFHDETLDRLAFKDKFYFDKTKGKNINKLQWYHLYNTELIDS